MKRFARESVGLNFTRVGCRTSDKRIVFSEAFSQLDNIWISASDLGSDGDFYWESTGEFFGIFDDWIEGEPALGTENFHCAHMAMDTININSTHRWKNGNCYSLFRFVCESVPTSTVLDSTLTAQEKLQQNIDQFPLVNSFSHRKSYYEISTNKVFTFYYFKHGTNYLKIH
jgi:Lectin C-type domain